MLCVQMSVVRSDNMLVLRSTCINMVLGTDMKKHFDIVSRFQVHIQPACFMLCMNLTCDKKPPYGVQIPMSPQSLALIHMLANRCLSI